MATKKPEFLSNQNIIKFISEHCIITKFKN